MQPDERAFRKDLRSPRFQAGVDRGDWRSASAWEWPHPVVVVSAAERDGAPAEFALRFTADGYPVTAPTAVPWDVASNGPLSHDLWPAGGRTGAAFNPQWNGGNALYIPCDRLAIQGHDAWQNQHQAYIWTPQKQIVDYLRIVHELLHSEGYSGVRRAA